MKPRELFRRGAPFLFFLALSVPHHEISEWYQEYILIPVGMNGVQFYVNMISAALGAVIIGYLYYRWRKERKVVGVALLSAVLILGLIALSDAALLVNNIERIHFVQYAGVAFLLRLGLEDNALVFFCTAYAGVLDEFIQYLMNPVRTSYLDFNDMVFNSLGAALGVVFAIVILSPERIRSSWYEMQFRRGFFALTSLTAALIVLALVTGRIVTRGGGAEERHVFSEVQGRLSFVISFESQKQFWETADNGKTFHILRPWEGMMMLAAIVPALWRIIIWLGNVKSRVREGATTKSISRLEHALKE